MQRELHRYIYTSNIYTRTQRRRCNVSCVATYIYMLARRRRAMQREHLAERIRELFALEVQAGLAPNSAAVVATKRARAEVELWERCRHLFPHVEQGTLTAVICSAPVAWLTHILASQLLELNNQSSPPTELPRGLLILDPHASPGKAGAKQKPTKSDVQAAPEDADGSAREAATPWESEKSLDAPVLARTVTVVVSASDDWYA